MHFPMITVIILTASVAHPASADEAESESAKVLERFVGVWKTAVTSKPAKWSPDGGKATVQEKTTWTLKKRFILGQELHSHGEKSLWLMTYEPKGKTYPFWMFSNKGLMGGQWSSTWDEATKTLMGKATDTPKGWTSAGKNHFPDKTSNHVAVWMKDDSGTLLFDMEANKARQPDEAGEKMLAAWSKMDKLDAPLPKELKVLDRLIGSWDTTAVSKPAVWTPKEVKTTSKVERRWILDGRFLLDTSRISEGSEGLSLMTYDPQMTSYRGWWFSSEGHTNSSTGKWDEKAETFSFVADLGNGLTSHSSAHFTDKDRHEWNVVVKDGDGKVYFDTTWTVTRRKE